MRRIMVVLTLSVGLANLVAQAPWVDWKPGTTVTQSYVELAGTLVIGQKIVPVLKSNGKEYLLLVDSSEPAALVWKTGSAIIIKGVSSTLEVAGQPPLLTLRPIESIVGGKTWRFRPEITSLLTQQANPGLAELAGTWSGE